MIQDLEDETGMLNVICSHGLWNRHRHTVRTHNVLLILGVLRREDVATNLVADRITVLEQALSGECRAAQARHASRDFR